MIKTNLTKNEKIPEVGDSEMLSMVVLSTPAFASSLETIELIKNEEL